jgi:hypothetical protein
MWEWLTKLLGSGSQGGADAAQGGASMAQSAAPAAQGSASMADRFAAGGNSPGFGNLYNQIKQGDTAGAVGNGLQMAQQQKPQQGQPVQAPQATIPQAQGSTGPQWQPINYLQQMQSQYMR